MRLVLALTLAVAGCTATSGPVSPSAAPGERRQEAALNRHAPHGKHWSRRPLLSRASRSLRRSPVALWDRLALCESGGRWHIHGYFDGGLQFLPSTWLAEGGAEFAPRADLASKAEQITVALRLLRTAGWSSWPVCSVTTGIAR